MSVKRFKIGDKVRVHDDIANTKDHDRDGLCILDGMKELAGRVFTIEEIVRYHYNVAENDWGWNDEMLEAAGEPLDNFCVGDDISRGSGVRRILAAVDGCYLLSNTDEYTVANDWYTADELKQIGYQVLPPGHSITLIEIDGKRYDEAEVKKAIKDLEPID